jgi:hypothetical protein
MQGKVALEEHFAIPDTLMDSAGFVPESHWPELKGRLLDIQDKRLAEMDKHGIEMMILSLNAPAVQAIPETAKADEIARRANDYLAEQVARRPSRFQAFAALPMQDPELAITELERCVRRSDSAARWSMDFRKSPIIRRQSTMTCRNIGRSGKGSSSSAFPSICIRAIRCLKIPGSMPAIPGCSARPGRSGRRPPSMRCA